MIPEKKRLATLIQNCMLFSLLLDTISPKYHPLFIVKVWMLKCEKKLNIVRFCLNIGLGQLSISRDKGIFTFLPFILLGACLPHPPQSNRRNNGSCNETFVLFSFYSDPFNHI